ncbi:teichoic acid ABC transporter ATP-binding protein [Gracilibacillus halophilus YIM-C55.5]|uniref:Teichoic acid ABC transporter ATP-binding protein n=1 Tax=Gracilibacillus halophilus YIM-C55.5 TaxID=1308866 RepID=N4WU09_9BACI|nr:ATP-binding cassette domain-containing protein [Gracilibacillus halophilus]ENH96581.1 teichoic acid ABC transporter ATP-binding protein [Gracilibacillus halophilus YIM-C55.5]
MSIEIKNQKNQSDEVVIHAKSLGVTFNPDFQKDDYKSHAIQFLKRKKKSSANKRKVWSLKDVDFTGYKGEVLGIIGSNGAGKTTLCKVLSGILEPDQGQLSVDGKVSALFSFGMGFRKELSGRENVYLNGMMLGIGKKQIQHFIDDIHEFSGLGSFMDQPMKYYSSGMKARLGFSVAAHLEPEILILDEALNTGDSEFSNKASEKIKELVSKAKMVILVTHSMPFAEKNCDRLIWLENGQVQEIGEPKTVVQHYKESMPSKPKKTKKTFELSETNIEIGEQDVITAKNVSVSYKLRKREFWALKDVSFNIKEGEIVGIIGHNGAGKSTLCKVLTKILEPEQGSMEIDGDTSALLGYGTGFNAQLSGADNIYLNGMLLGMPLEKVENNFQHIVDFSELGKKINRPVKEYSSGMKARLGFSIAATLQPDIFIIDEALSTGDMAFRQKATEKIQEMIHSAKAVLVVSHSMNFVETVCTRAIWFEQGQVMYDGKPSEAVSKYNESVKSKKQKTGNK